MTSTLPFAPRNALAARAQLGAYIEWAKTTLQQSTKVKAGVEWGAFSWQKHGVPRSRVSKLGSTNERLDPAFVDFAKSVLVQRALHEGKGMAAWSGALRSLEQALLTVNGNADVTQASAAVFAKACEIAAAHWSKGDTAYITTKALERILAVLTEKRLLAVPFTWRSPLKLKRSSLAQAEADAVKKLPDDAALKALGELFHNKPTLPLDIVVTSAAALLLSQPSRIGELAYVPVDVLHTETTQNGGQQLYLRWYAEKGFGSKPAAIPASMADVCKEAVERVKAITQEARDYARWLEDHPDTFPDHPKRPKKGQDTPLTLQEACDAVMISTDSNGPRRSLRKWLRELKKTSISPDARAVVTELLNGFEAGKGQRVYENGHLARYVFNDTYTLTLRKLNVLVRERFLPRTFPYTDDKQITKFSEALFCCLTGALDVSKKGRFSSLGVMLGADSARLRNQFTGADKHTSSIFERHGYEGVRVASHSFRHYLNTAGQRVGLSQTLLAAWSGRVDINQNRVYNHMTPQEKTMEVARLSGRVNTTEKGCTVLEKINTNQPITLSDITGNEEQSRHIHWGPFGACLHDYSETPCLRQGACIGCGEMVCVKGEEVKLAQLKAERDRLQEELSGTYAAVEAGLFGANQWLVLDMEKLERCNGLIEALENPDNEDGALIFSEDDGRNVMNRALEMQGIKKADDSPLLEADQHRDVLSGLKALLNKGVE